MSVGWHLSQLGICHTSNALMFESEYETYLWIAKLLVDGSGRPRSLLVPFFTQFEGELMTQKITHSETQNHSTKT